MSVRSNRRVPIKQNRSMTKVQRVSNSSSDVCSDEISGQWRFTHRLRRAPSADSDYPPATHLPHSHVMLSSHRRQDKSVIRRPLIGSSSVGYRNHHTIISGSSADDRSDSGQNLYEREGSFRSLFAITRMSSDEVQMKMSYQCPTSVLLLSDYLPVAPITLLLVTYQHYICVTNWNVSNQYPTKLVGSEKSTFRPASGLCGRGASSWVVTSVTLTFDLCPWPLAWTSLLSLSGVPDFFYRNKILSGGDLSHYQVPHCIRVFFYFVWFVFIHHNFQFYFELCTYCNILDIHLS